MNKIIEFTQDYEITDVEASKILGVSRGSISDWRSGHRQIPDYIVKSIDIHMNIPCAHKERIKTMVRA